MAGVAIERAVKRYGQVEALADVTLDLAEGEFFGLLGPSGSGKTTLLRAIAGFVALDSGSIRIGGEAIDRVPVYAREIGLVFQSYALFPHMSVARNVAFGLEVRGVAGPEIQRRVGDILDLVQLSGLEARRPAELSGGQQQRVALARALVTRPRVLLLDEPLAALDKRLRQAMQIELKQIQREVGITTVFVTHDQEEALTLSDRVALFDQGQIVQAGAPRELYDWPKSRFAATFLGAANILVARVVERRGDDLLVAVPGGERLVVPEAARAPGEPLTLAIRPERTQVLAAEAGEGLAGTVIDVVFAGPSLTYSLAAAGTEILAIRPNTGAEVLPPGAAVRVAWQADDARVLED